MTDTAVTLGILIPYGWHGRQRGVRMIPTVGHVRDALRRGEV